MSKFLKSMDLFGPKFELSFGGKTRYQSKTGGILTILAYIFILSSFGLLMNQLFDPKNVDVSTVVQYSQVNQKIDLAKNVFYPIVGIRLPNPEDDGLVRLIDANENYTRFFYGVAFTGEFNYTNLEKRDFNSKLIEEFAFFPCKTIKSPLKDKIYELNEKMRDFGEKYGFCLNMTNLDNFWVEGNVVEPPYRFFSMSFFPCIRGSEEDCAPKEQISGIELFILSTKFGFDPENKNNPVSRTAAFEENIRFNLFFKKTKTIRFKTTKIYDDRGEFAGDPEYKTEFQDVDESSISYGARGSISHFCDFTNGNQCDALVEIALESDKKEVKIVRSYKKIFDILGEFGGVVEIVITAAGLLYLVYSFSKVDRSLAKKVYKGDLESLDSVIKEKNSEEIKKSMIKILDEDKNIINIFKQLSYAKVMKEALLTDEEKILLPYVLANFEMKNKGVKNKGKETVFSEGGQGANYELEVDRLKAFVPENRFQEDIQKYFLEKLPGSLINKISDPELEGAKMRQNSKFFL